MKKYSYTYFPTIKTYEGDNILLDTKVISDFLKKTFMERILNLTEEEKNEYFTVAYEYEDVLTELFDSQVEKVVQANWTMDPLYRNPIEEYENYVSLPKDEDLTDEEHELKLQVLKEFKEWFEKQNY
jgi:hypothetical protein